MQAMPAPKLTDKDLSGVLPRTGHGAASVIPRLNEERERPRPATLDEAESPGADTARTESPGASGMIDSPP